MPASNAILAAHGYLISQFLSPVDNRRTDECRGSLQGCMRFLVKIYQGMRETLGPDFPIAVKLNSSDGDLGGMSQEDSLRVAVRLSELGVDVLEVSGGPWRLSRTCRSAFLMVRADVGSSCPGSPHESRRSTKRSAVSCSSAGTRCRHRLARGGYASARGNGLAALAFTVRRHGPGALMPRRARRRG